MLKLKRTDSTIIIVDNNKICVIMSPLKMQEKIKYIEYSLKNKFKYIT